ncbi:MAG: magnesium transporter [Deltaproteobacteria bacterium]|nr:magnesium transporter [Deltaproteobacteria bacterium]
MPDQQPTTPLPVAPPPQDDDAYSVEDLRDAWHVLARADRVQALRALPRDTAEEFFFELGARDQAHLLLDLPQAERRSWLRLLEPDDVADLVQEAGAANKDMLLGLLDETTKREVQALLAYAEDHAGGLMSTRFGRLRPEMTIAEAVTYLRKQSRESIGTIYYVYVLDQEQRILGVVSFRELLTAEPSQIVREVMHTEVHSIPEEMDQEQVGQLFAKTKFLAMPVVDAERRIKGIITADDVVNVVEEEATEDIQKMGGTEALGEPYLQISFWAMIKKRAGWLAVLFVGEMFTATAMGFFEKEIEKAVVLALFTPLIISSGGNSGSQATSLVIRAMALREITLRDWFRVVRRELGSGFSLGFFLGCIGFARITLWHFVFGSYPDHHWLLATTVFASLIGVVAFGTVVGALLPFILRKLGFDPASASAPFVATLSDVSGLVIYFSVAAATFLRGAGIS